MDIYTCRVSLCSPGWSGTRHVDQADLLLVDIQLSLNSEGSACLCLLSIRIKGMYHSSQPVNAKYVNTNSIPRTHMVEGENQLFQDVL